MYSQWEDKHQVVTDSLYRGSSRFLRFLQIWLAIKQATVAILLDNESTKPAAQLVVLRISLVKDFELLAALNVHGMISGARKQMETHVNGTTEFRILVKSNATTTATFA